MTRFLVLFIFLLPSCVVYQETSVSLIDAVNKGKVKVVTKNNKKLKFSNIVVENSLYNGIKVERQKNDQGIYENITKYNKLYQDSINSIYLEKTVANAWIKIKNTKKYVKGILYQADESSIIIADNNNSIDYSNGHIRYSVSDIIEIKLRTKNNVALGAGIGAMTGITVSIILIAIEPFNLILSPLILLTTATGAIIGAKRKTYKIDGNVEMYMTIMADLKKYSYLR